MNIFKLLLLSFGLTIFGTELTYGQTFCGNDESEQEKYRYGLMPSVEKSGGVICSLEQTDQGIGVEIVGNRFKTLKDPPYNGEISLSFAKSFINSTVDRLNRQFSFLGYKFYTKKITIYQDDCKKDCFTTENTIRIRYGRRGGIFAPCGALEFDKENPVPEIFVNLDPLLCLEKEARYLQLSNLNMEKYIERILFHEFGHFAGLFDTMRGSKTWYSESPDPNHIYKGRKSCYDFGDGFCDTAADPNLFNMVNENCEYDWEFAGLKEPPLDRRSNTPFNPNTMNNYMSYSRYECVDSFTPEQINFMASFFPNLVCSETEGSVFSRSNLKINAFPNPFSSQIMISIRKVISSEMHPFKSVSIFSSSGSLVRKYNGSDFTNIDDNTRVVNIMWDGTNSSGQKVPNGLYFVQILGNKSHNSRSPEKDLSYEVINLQVIKQSI